MNANVIINIIKCWKLKKYISLFAHGIFIIKRNYRVPFFLWLLEEGDHETINYMKNQDNTTVNKTI